MHPATLQYVLRQFDAGIQPCEIMNTLHIAGHKGIHLSMIEECLQNSGRQLKSHNPPTNPVCEISAK